MAKDKKSFLLYCDMIATVEKLPDEVAGKLLKMILEYVNDKNPETNDLLLQIAFEPIKLQLKRDLKNWEQFREKQSMNGKQGGRPPKAKPFDKKPKNPSLKSESQKSLTVTVTDTVNETVTDNVKSKIEDRKQKFAHSLEPFLESFGKEVLNAFYKYWTEPNKSKTKMKFELQQTWDLKRRLERWVANDKNFAPKVPIKTTIVQERNNELDKLNDHINTTLHRTGGNG